MSWSVNPKTLSNCSASILRFTQFCDALNIPEYICMPAPKWLLSIFVTTHGAGSVGGGAIKSWLLGLEFWHLINGAPWYGASHLRKTAKVSHTLAPLTSSRAPRSPMTIRHLHSLKNHLTLTDTFNVAVFGTATVTFWCQCLLAEVTVDNKFDPALHASHSSPQMFTTTMSKVKFHSFWAPKTKTHPRGEEI